MGEFIWTATIFFQPAGLPRFFFPDSVFLRSCTIEPCFAAQRSRCCCRSVSPATRHDPLRRAQHATSPLHCAPSGVGGAEFEWGRGKGEAIDGVMRRGGAAVHRGCGLRLVVVKF